MIVPTLALLLGVAGAAAVAAPPDAVITPGPAPELVRRVSYSTLGWYSSTEIGGTVSWDYIEYDADSTTYFTSGNFYRRCLKGRESLCPMYTSCSSGYMLASTTSTYCGMYISICSWNVMYSSYGGSNPKTGLWCDDPSYTGDTLYATSPGTVAGSGPTRIFSSIPRITPTSDADDFTSVASTPTITDNSASSTTDIFAGPLTTTSEAASSSSKSSNDGSKRAGIIAGATIGGIALLGAFVVAIIFILRRTRRDPQPVPYMPQPPMNQPPAAMATMPEKHASMVNAAHVPQPAMQQPVAMDPRNSNYYGQGSMSPPPTSQPLPQYPGYNEMPTNMRGP